MSNISSSYENTTPTLRFQQYLQYFNIQPKIEDIQQIQNILDLLFILDDYLNALASKETIAEFTINSACSPKIINAIEINAEINDKNLLCCVCKKIPVQHVQLTNCNHILCKNCAAKLLVDILNQPPSDDYVYINCPICNQQSENFRWHKSILRMLEQNIKNIECPKCGQILPTLQQYIYHERQHFEEIPAAHLSQLSQMEDFPIEEKKNEINNQQQNQQYDNTIEEYEEEYEENIEDAQESQPKKKCCCSLMCFIYFILALVILAISIVIYLIFNQDKLQLFKNH